MKTLDEVSDMLFEDGRGFFVVQYDSKDGRGVEFRYKADDMETMLGFLIPIVDSICNEYVENEGYMVCESIRQTVEKTMMMNDTRPSEKLFEENIAKIREIFAKYDFHTEDPDDDDNPPLTWDELKQIEGKPVWIEGDLINSHWDIVRGFGYRENFDEVDYENEVVSFYRETWDFCEKELGKTWQAYRKEHHDDN